MPIKITADSFLNVVRQSALIEPERLKKLMAEFRDSGLDVSNSPALAEALVDRGALTRWQADKLLQGRHKGFFLGKYRLMSLLGKGGMSSVYLADHVLMRRRCAIKVLPAKRVDDSSYLGRFHREAQAVASLDHPNIVRAYDVDKEVDGQTEIHFLVMEYVEGRDLQEIVHQEGPLDFIRTAEYIRQAALGIGHAHKAGMVHRDIKPANLLVDKSDTVKILDLGLARFFDDKDEKSLTVAHDEKVLGTADYLAPEQALDSHSVDARADIYSLGCTLFFLLTGSPPFNQGTLAQRLMAHQAKEPPTIASLRADAPETLVAIARKMMAKRADDRHQSAEEVWNALTLWLADNADESWKSQHSLVPGNGSGELGSGPRSRREGDESAVAAAPAIAASDDPLASFLTNLSTRTEDAPSRAAPSRAHVFPAPAASIPAKPASRTSTPPTPPSSRDRPAPVAQPIASRGTAVATAASSSPAASAVSEPPAAEPRSVTTAGFPRLQVGAWIAGLRRRPRLTLVIAGIAGVAAALGGYFAIVDSPDKTPRYVTDDEDVQSREERLRKEQEELSAKLVDRNLGPVVAVGSGGDFQTIAEAIADTHRFFQPANDQETRTIKVVGGRTYPEAIFIDGSDSARPFPRGVTIVSDGSQPAVLAPSGTDPVVTIRNANRFVFEGFTVKADGKSVAIAQSGDFESSRLRNLRISGFTKTGIHATSTAGHPDAGNEAYFENIELTGDGPEAVGIRIGSEDGIPATSLVVTECRFFGPMSAGVVIQDAPNEITIENSIFSGTGIGVRFDNPGEYMRAIRLLNNTFHELDHGVTFTGLPSQVSSGFAFARNLFAGMRGAEVLVRDEFDEERFSRLFDRTNGLAFNFSDREKPQTPGPGEPTIVFEGRAASRGSRQGVAAGFRSTERSAADFLTPASDSPAAKVEVAKDEFVHVGAKKP
ncbi:MAG: protein kinase [Planctomycetaceae bacterium]